MPAQNQISKPLGFGAGPRAVPFKQTSGLPTTTEFGTNEIGIHVNSLGGRALVLNHLTDLYGLELHPVASLYRRSREKWVVATGVANTDLANFKAAVAACVAEGGGTIVVDGVHTWPQNDPATGFPPYFNMDGSNIIVRGTLGAKLVGHSSRTARIDIGGSPVDMSTGGVAITGGGVERFASDFENSGSCVAGDYLALWADNVITEMAPSEVGGIEYPGCLRRVMAVEGTRVILDAPVPDTMTTSPKLKKITMRTGCVWERLHVENIVLVPTVLAGAKFYGLTLVNCGTIGLGAINFNFCHDNEIAGCIIDNNGVTAGIGCTVGMSHGVTIHSNTFFGSGHMFDTGRGRQWDDAGTIKVWGDPTGWIFRGNRLNSWANASGGNQPIDSHARGYDGWIDGNEVFLNGYISGGSQTAITAAVRARCRKLRVTNNKFFGPAVGSIDTATWGVNADGAGEMYLANNLYSRLAGGIYLFDAYGGHTMDGEKFMELSHHAIRMNCGGSAQESLIQGCVCRSHSGQGFGAEPVSWIRSQNGTKIRAIWNYLPKAHASMQNSVVAEGSQSVHADLNYCPGWGAGSHGMTGAGLYTPVGNTTD